MCPGSRNQSSLRTFDQETSVHTLACIPQINILSEQWVWLSHHPFTYGDWGHIVFGADAVGVGDCADMTLHCAIQRLDSYQIFMDKQLGHKKNWRDFGDVEPIFKVTAVEKNENSSGCGRGGVRDICFLWKHGSSCSPDCLYWIVLHYITPNPAVHDNPYISKQCRSWFDVFWRRIYTVCLSFCEFERK